MKYSKKIKMYLSFSLFLLVSFGVFAKVSYLYRPANNTRDTIVGLSNEKENLYDVMYIGGSDAFVFWQPPRAWYEYGISSYVYGTNTLQAETIKREMVEISKSQSPKLWVISARSFEYWEPKVSERGIRNITDSLPYSVNRLFMVRDSFRYKNTDNLDLTSYFLDIATYHTNTDAIKNIDNWCSINNNCTSKYKGWEFESLHEYLTRPAIANVNRVEPISKESEAILVDLLEYCKKSDYQVLFVVIPFHATELQIAKHNYIQEIVERYDYSFINGNKLYDEIEVDFSKDYYDINHMNDFGASKYTEYLSKYLVDNYELNDCRKDPRFDEWGRMCNEFAIEEEQVNRNVFELIEAKEYSKKKTSRIRETDDVSEWLALANDQNYYMLIETHGDSWRQMSQSREILGRFSIPEDNSSNQIRAYYGGNEELSVFGVQDLAITNRFPNISDMEIMYSINCGEMSQIVINDKDYAVQGDGMSLVLYDIANKEIVDSVLLYQNENDEIELKR